MAESKSYQVLWTHTARQDLIEITNFIAQDSIDDALLILHKLETQAARLMTFPNRGRIVPELLHTGISQYRDAYHRALAHYLPGGESARHGYGGTR